MDSGEDLGYGLGRRFVFVLKLRTEAEINRCDKLLQDHSEKNNVSDKDHNLHA